MIEEQAVITKKQGELVTLEIERATACSLCGQKRGCGNATWGKLLGHDQHSVEVENTIEAKVGDLVMVGLEEKVMLNAAMMLYVMPLAGLMLFALLAHWLFGDDLSVILGAVLGLVSGFIFAKRFYRPQAPVNVEPPPANQRTQPYARLLRIVGQSTSQQ